MAENTQVKMPDIRHTIEINAPIEKVWKAVSTSEGMAAWFMQNDFQPETGREFHLQSPFGPVGCKVLEIDPPNRLSFSWDDFGWRVTFELAEREGKTQFTVIHSGWGEPDEIVPRAGQKNSMIHATMDGGWDHLTKGLHDKLSEG